MRVTHGLLAVVVLVAGCGQAPSSTGTAAVGGDEPTTPRSLAFVASEYAGEPDSATTDEDAAEEFASGGVGAELRFGSDGEYDGDMLVVAVGSGLDTEPLDCESSATEGLAGCEQTDRGTLMWEDEAPEADPGVVYLVVPKGDAHVLVFYAGPAITGDPRDLDLPIDVDTLFDLASDPRVDVTTSQEAIEGGKQLEAWHAG